jgi:hypothetical protein
VPANRSAATPVSGPAWTPSALLISGVSLVKPLSDDQRKSPSGTELLGLAGYLAAAVLIPLLIGLAIDSGAHTSPLGLLVGVVVGVAAATAGLWSRLKRYM